MRSSSNAQAKDQELHLQTDCNRTRRRHRHRVHRARSLAALRHRGASVARSDRRNDDASFASARTSRSAPRRASSASASTKATRTPRRWKGLLSMAQRRWLLTFWPPNDATRSIATLNGMLFLLFWPPLMIVAKLAESLAGESRDIVVRLVSVEIVVCLWQQARRSWSTTAMCLRTLRRAGSVC